MDLDEIKKAVIDLNIDNISELVQNALKEGESPQKLLGVLTEGMNEVGKLYENKDYFLTDLILAGETMKEALKILSPHLKAEKMGSKQKVICATVKGDNHDIGKNILITMLLSAGFEVIDLGIDCPPNLIVKAVKNTGAKVVALSSLLTMTVNEISEVIEALKKAGLRDKVKIIVGGAPLNMELAKKLGADDYASDAIDGVRHIKALMED
ncbi:MAG: cobalamin B12-binding domain-containing protein [Candidatus Helarchaeota archaeon]